MDNWVRPVVCEPYLTPISVLNLLKRIRKDNRWSGFGVMCTKFDSFFLPKIFSSGFQYQKGGEITCLSFEDCDYGPIIACRKCNENATNKHLASTTGRLFIENGYELKSKSF
jgi:hypothetical protein